MFQENVEKFLTVIKPLLKAKPKYADRELLSRITTPDKIIEFDVEWKDDSGNKNINKAWRVQFDNTLGPYKGGMRLHPSVNVDILKSLAFEQIFKNSLTTLDLGGAKGGSNFDPHGKSDEEVVRFCSALMTKLAPNIGPTIDVPAGDIGVGPREITAFLNTYLNIYGDTLQNRGVLTGKKIEDGGSLCRKEATGYGLVYFAAEHLNQTHDSLKDKRVLISGSGNVAIYACEKAQQLGATVLTMSDSNGYVFDEKGIDIELVKQIKEVERARISEYAKRKSGVKYIEGKRPWEVQADLCLPCATQNEIELDDAKNIANNDVILVAEGSNLSTTTDAQKILKDANVMYFPGKASNAGGVTVSGFEMQQNAAGQQWSFDEVDAKLQTIMQTIYHNCLEAASKYSSLNDFVTGANIAGFIRIADAI